MQTSTSRKSSSVLAALEDRWFARPLLIALSLVALLVLGGVFLASVLVRPTRTPILTLTGTYDSDWDLNVWVAEDLEAISGLAERTFSVTALPPVDQLVGGIWDDADHRIREAFQDCPSGGPLVVYINLHGVVDDQGRVCLVPPSGVVNDASTWFAVESLLDHIEQAQPGQARHPVVLLMECGRIRSHWPAGIAENDFDDQLTDLLARHQQTYPNSDVTILSSVARGQRSQFSRLGYGDVFTRYVVEGLAGAADGSAGTRRKDDVIDSGELYTFVRERVSRWAMRHRAVSQTPTLHRCGAAEDVAIARVGKRRPAVAVSTPPPTDAELKRLHAAFDSIVELRSHDPVSVNSYRWSQAQRTVHALGQSVFGGKAVRELTPGLYERLDRQVEILRKQIAMRSGKSATMNDLEMTGQAIGVWSALAKQPSRDVAMELIKSIGHTEIMPIPMLLAAVNRPASPFWQRTQSIKRLAVAQQQWLGVLQTLNDGLFPAVIPVAEPVDDARRQLADSILALDGDQIERSLSHFEETVKSQTALLAELNSAWRNREQAFVELPFLYQWDDESKPETDLVTSDQTDVLRQAVALDDLLIDLADGRVAWSEDKHQQIVVLSTQVGDQVTALNQIRNDSLVLDADQPMTAMKATANHCKLVAADPFMQSRAEAKFRELDLELSQCRDDDQAASEAHAPVAGKIAGKIDSKIAGNRGKDSATRSSTHLATWLGITRDLYSPSLARQKIRQWSSVGGSDQDHRWRRIVSLVTSDDYSRVMDQNMAEARRFRLASTASKVLDDFWREPASGETPYFASTTQTLMDVANELTGPTARWNQFHAVLDKKLASRKRAALDGISLSAIRSPSLASDLAETVSVAVDGNPSDAAPMGQALLAIRCGQQQTLTSTSTPASGTKSQLELAIKKGLSEGPSDGNRLSSQGSVVELRFRGHLFETHVVASDTTRGVTASLAAPSGDALITVSASNEDRRSICFVLDCSASMNDPVPAEVARSDEATRPPTKLDAARWAVYEMMRQVQPDATEVGLVLYGHRIAQGTAGQGLLVQKRYHKSYPFPATLQPFEDVETVLMTGRFGVTELQSARQRLDQTVPWGQTPLFLSIDRAIDDVARVGDDSIKDVVVISDGANYQFNPTPEAVVPLASLILKAQTKKVRVHVIGFGVSDHESSTALEQFQNIAVGTGGKMFHDAKQAGELLEQLRQTASGKTFSVQLADREPITAALGQAIKLTELDRNNVPVKISVQGHDNLVPISPGNHLQLTADVGGQVLHATAYTKRSPQFVNLVDPTGLRVPVRLGVHQPVANGDDMQFELSMQRRDGIVVDRPAIVWVELGQSNRSTGIVSRYCTPSVQWVTGTTCPIARLACRDWSGEAERYEVDLWCSHEKPAGHRLRLPGESQEFQPLSTLTGTQVRVSRSGQTTRIELRYSSSQSKVDAMLIVQPATDQEGSATHWYDPLKMTSTHEFVGPAAGVREFWCCRVSDLKSHAVRTEATISGSLGRPQTVVAATR